MIGSKHVMKAAVFYVHLLRSVISEQNTVRVARCLVFLISITMFSEAALVSRHPVHRWLLVPGIVPVVHRDSQLLSVHIFAFLHMPRQIHVG
jgi:hypothetical protein